MSPVNTSRQKYAPKHRMPPRHRAARGAGLVRRAPGSAVRRAAVLSTAAVAATGVAVTGGLSAGPVGTSPLSASLGSADLASAGIGSAAGLDRPDVDDAGPGSAELGGRADLDERVEPVSRSDSRAATDRAKQAALGQQTGGVVVRTEEMSSADPRDIAMALLPEYGFGPEQFPCLDSLYVSESDWRIDADNPTSSAYGIPQALTELHDLPPDYATSAEAQIRWGLEYIADSYGSPCSAWTFKQANNWY